MVTLKRRDNIISLNSSCKRVGKEWILDFFSPGLGAYSGSIALMPKIAKEVVMVIGSKKFIKIRK